MKSICFLLESYKDYGHVYYCFCWIKSEKINSYSTTYNESIFFSEYIEGFIKRETYCKILLIVWQEGYGVYSEKQSNFKGLQDKHLDT